MTSTRINHKPRSGKSRAKMLPRPADRSDGRFRSTTEGLAQPRLPWLAPVAAVDILVNHLEVKRRGRVLLWVEIGDATFRSIVIHDMIRFEYPRRTWRDRPCFEFDEPIERAVIKAVQQDLDRRRHDASSGAWRVGPPSSQALDVWISDLRIDQDGVVTVDLRGSGVTYRGLMMPDMENIAYPHLAYAGAFKFGAVTEQRVMALVRARLRETGLDVEVQIRKRAARVRYVKKSVRAWAKKRRSEKGRRK